jgi:tetratricopeptide (TPR) repeat protein
MGKASQETTGSSGHGFDASDCKRRELDSVQKSLLENPLDMRALTRAGLLLYEMGRFEESAAHLTKAMASPMYPAGQSATDVDWNVMLEDPSQEDLADVHCRILMQMGDSYAASADAELAERHYHAARALSPAQSAPYVGLGTLSLAGGRLEQAREFFETATQLQPDCGEAYGGLAIIHQNRQNYSEAFEMHLKCLELDTDNLMALLGLFQASCEMGTFSKIIHYLEVYLARNPTDTSVLFCLATLYAREGRLHDARRVTLEILTHEPEKQGAAELLVKVNDSLAGIDN